jgi:hypothetical protein
MTLITIQFEDELLCHNWLKFYATEIHDTWCQWTDDKQKADLLSILKQINKLFDGCLSIYPHHQLHIDINHDADAKPVHVYPYSMTCIHLLTFKCELDHLSNSAFLHLNKKVHDHALHRCSLEACNVHWISNLQQLYKVIKQEQYTLPMITDILYKCIEYKFFTA